MKFKYYLLPFIVGATLTVLNSCGGDDLSPVDLEKDRLAELSFTWNFSEVTISGIDISSAFSNASLSFTETKTFQTTNISEPFDQIFTTSGNFEFGSGGTNLDVIVIKEIEMTIVSVTSTQLVLSFTYITASIHKVGKNASAHVDYVATFTKK